MGMVNKFIAICKDEVQLDAYKAFVYQLLSSKYVGKSYKHRIRGQILTDVQRVENDYCILTGELWSCGLADVGHWIAEYGKSGKFPDVIIFVSRVDSDYVELCNVLGETQCNVWDLEDGAVCGECIYLVKDYPMRSVADYFEVDYYE